MTATISDWDFLVQRIQEPPWRRNARCQGEDGFFPTGRPRKKPLELCSECPVRAECLEFALDPPWPPSGTWAGLTSTELYPLWQERHGRTA